MPTTPLLPISADRVLGCLAGGAVGDALGYQVEFYSYDQIALDRGPQGVTGPREGEPLLASDDTQMSLFTAEALLAVRASQADPRREHWREDFRVAYLDWLLTQARGSVQIRPGSLAAETLMREQRAPGITCMGALKSGGHGTTTNPINDSKGCGGVMRTAPIGLLALPCADLQAAAQLAYDLGCDAAAITHGHALGWLSAGAMAAMVRLLVGGMTLPEAVAVAIDLVLDSADAPEQHRRTMADLLELALYQAAENPKLKPRSLEATFGGGWVGEEALAIGLFAALAGVDFSDAIRIAATHSGDSDSTASIAGQLLGARDGMACVPPDWWQATDLRPVVIRMADGLVEANRRG